MQEQASRVLLEQANQLFSNRKFLESKQKIGQLNQTNNSIELNQLLIDFEVRNREGSSDILKKLLNMLTEINIDIYEKNRPKKINFIAHQLLYYNIIALSKYLGFGPIIELAGSQALFFAKSMKISTSFPIIYECLKRYLMQNRMQTSLEIIQKFQKIVQHCRRYNFSEQKYKTLISALYIKSLLKMGLIEESQGLFMLNFGETEQQKFEQEAGKHKNKDLTYDSIMSFLHAQIQFYSEKYEKSINILSGPLSCQQMNKRKLIAENNLGIILSMKKKVSSAERILITNCQNIYKMMGNPKKVDPELQELYMRSKQNIFIAQLKSRESQNSSTHYALDMDQKTYNHMKHLQQLFSYQHQYRRGQCCLNLYHSILEKTQRKLPWDQIHDNYDNVYYHPNQPYFQFKGRNKNLHLANKKPVYRRYVLNEWNDNPDEEQVDKDFNRRKFEKQAAFLKLKSLLSKAQDSFKKALLILEKQEAVIVNLSTVDPELRKTINQKLFYEAAKYRSSILCMLCYTCLCESNWTEVIFYGQQFEKKKCFETSSQDYYCVLSYMLEAYCELDKIESAYNIMRKLMNETLTKNEYFDCRDSSSLSNCIFEYNQNQQINFCYNLAVLHSRDSRISESYQSIQKLFSQLNIIPNYSRADLPLSVVELLIHHYLRIKNVAGALQMIKRRRMIVGSMAAINKPILNITK